jgi:hypothetical protein
MTAARFLLALALVEAAGLALLTRLSREPRSGPGAMGLAFFLGTLAAGLWTHLLLWVRIPVTPLTVAAGLAAMAALGRWKDVRAWVWKRPPAPAWLLAPAAAFLLFGALSWPLLGYDGEVMYLPKAKSIAHYGTFWNEDFTDPARVLLAHRRPLLLPSIYADVALLSGSWDARLIRVWFTLLQVAGAAALYDVLRGRTDRASAAWATALYAWLPALWHDAGGACSAYADAPLSLLFVFSLVSGPRLAIVLLAAGVLLKDEGLAFLLPLALVRGPKLILIPAAVAAAWMATASFLPRDDDFLPARFLQPHLAELPRVVRQVGSEMLAVKHWSVLWLTVLGTLAWKARRLGREDARWLLPAAVQVAAYVGVWLSFPPQDLARLIKMEDMRLLMHVAPLAWVWSVGRATSA